LWQEATERDKHQKKPEGLIQKTIKIPFWFFFFSLFGISSYPSSEEEKDV